MRNLLTIAALAAGLATAANAATPTTSRHHHMTKADNGSAAVRELNEKSLQQAEAGTPMASPTAAPAMSDSGAAVSRSDAGAAMPMNSGSMNSGSANSSTMTPTDATPTAPTTPQ